MKSWLTSLILGAVQGLTEFLPVSSSGHLAVFETAFSRWFREGGTGAEKVFFFVMLHLGTLAAIVVHYRKDAAAGARGLLGSADVPAPYRRDAVIRAGLLAIVATLPAIPVGLLLKERVEAAFENATVAGVGFFITAAVLLLTLRLRAGDKGPGRTTWLDALLIGMAQAFAILPGVSRSGMTIAAALALGLSRTWAVGFSLLMAVLSILGAAVLELKDFKPAAIGADRAAQIVAATALAGLVGYLAIVWLVRIVRVGHLWYFSVYLVLLGAVVLASGLGGGGTPDGRQSPALDGPARGGAGRPGGAGAAVRPVRALDRADTAGTRAHVGDPGAGVRRGVPAEGLDLG